MSKFAALLAAILFGLLRAQARGGPAGEPGVTFTIAPETYISSDTATLCRVTATNHSGRSLDARTLVFEARAREHGRIVARERGRFGGRLENGATVETVIAFTGSFLDFEVGPAAGPAGDRQGLRRKGRKGSGGKSGGGRKRKSSR